MVYSIGTGRAGVHCAVGEGGGGLVVGNRGVGVSIPDGTSRRRHGRDKGRGERGVNPERLDRGDGGREGRRHVLHERGQGQLDLCGREPNETPTQR